MDMDCCWQSCLFQQLQGSVWVTIHRYHHAAKEWQHSPHTERQSRGFLVDKVVYFNSCKALCGLRSTGTTMQPKDGSTARIQRVAAQPAYRETIQGVIGTMSHLVNLFIHHEMITHLASRKYATPDMRMEPGTKVEGWPYPYLVRYGRGYQCPTGCNTCDWFHLSPPWYISVRLTLHSPSTLITLGPHEAGIWVKHPSLTLPAGTETSRHLGSSYQQGVPILSPLIADLSGLWGSSMQVMHGRPQGLFPRWPGG